MRGAAVYPQWAPRVARHRIRRLYEMDAEGIHDDEFIDEVGYALFSRCKSFIEANRAVGGKAPCPVCGEVVRHNGNTEEKLQCAQCGWELGWGEYFSTIQRKQLSGAQAVIELFEKYVDEFPRAEVYQEKMYLIDRLIHGFHWHQKYGATRPCAVNLIEGRLGEVIEFLDTLSLGKASTPGIRENRQEWVDKSQYVREWAGEKHKQRRTQRE